MTRIFFAFLASVIVTYLLAVLAYTQLNLANLVEMGVSVSSSIRVDAAIHDLLSMSELYLPIISVALLLGFLFVRLALIWLSQLRTLGYILGGFTGICAIDFMLGMLVGTHPLAVTRTTVGLLSQALAGAIGGYVFSFVSVRQQESEK